MELMELIEVRADVILAIVGLIEVVKNIVEKQQLSIYMLLTLAISYGLAQLMGGGFAEVALNTAIHFGLASLFYRMIVRYVENKTQELKEKT